MPDHLELHGCTPKSLGHCLKTVTILWHPAECAADQNNLLKGNPL